MRWTAASVLGRLGEPEAAGFLLGALADPHPEVRRQALLGLGVAGARGARTAIKRLAHDDPEPRVQAAAREALALLADD